MHFVDAGKAFAIQRKAFQETFGLLVQTDIREIPVYILVRKDSIPLGLILGKNEGIPQLEYPDSYLKRSFPFFWPYIRKWTRVSFRNYSTSDLAFWLEQNAYLLEESKNIVIVDETNLNDRYDFELVHDLENDIKLVDSLEKLGLKLKEANREVFAVYIDKDSHITPSVELKDLDQDPQIYPSWEKN